MKHTEEGTQNIIFCLWKQKIIVLWLMEKIYVKNNVKWCKNILKIAIDYGDDYTIGCLLDYSYFKKEYKLITIDLNKQQVLDANPKLIQQINKSNQTKHVRITATFFIVEDAQETISYFSQETVRVL